MATESKTRLMTAEELLTFVGEPDKRYELVNGELIAMSPPGGEHGQIAFRAGGVVDRFVEPRRLGILFAAGTGCRLRRDPDLVRAPDLAFVARGRLPGDKAPPGYIPLAPDFVVEVVSPNDTASEILDRVDDWLQAGTSVVWAVYPSKTMTLIFRGLDRIDRRSADDELDAGPVLPGFRCKVRDLFPEEGP